MSFKKIILTAAVAAAAFSFQANAGHDHEGRNHHPVEEKQIGMAAGGIIHVDVNGLVCDFCAQSISKVFMKTGAVEDMNVNLKRKFITVYLKEGKNLTDKKVKKLLEDSGYTTVTIHRYGKAGGG